MSSQIGLYLTDEECLKPATSEVCFCLYTEVPIRSLTIEYTEVIVRCESLKFSPFIEVRHR